MRINNISDFVKPSHLPRVTAFIATLAIGLCYFIAIYLGHEQPLPKTDISHTAAHYPEYVIFRISMISTAVFIIVIWVIENWYLREISKIHLIKLPYHIILVPIGTAASLFFCMSTATIDSGKMNTNLHGICARNFFILIILNIVINQVYVN
jgi:hypothetical protein